MIFSAFLCSFFLTKSFGASSRQQELDELSMVGHLGHSAHASESNWCRGEDPMSHRWVDFLNENRIHLKGLTQEMDEYIGGMYKVYYVPTPPDDPRGHYIRLQSQLTGGFMFFRNGGRTFGTYDGGRSKLLRFLDFGGPEAILKLHMNVSETDNVNAIRLQSGWFRNETFTPWFTVLSQRFERITKQELLGMGEVRAPIPGSEFQYELDERGAWWTMPEDDG